MPRISIKAEPLFHILGLTITNSYLASLIVIGLTLFLGLYFQKQNKSSHKSNFYYFIIFFIKSIYTFFESVFGDKTSIFFPLIGAFFFYILLQNWFGLLPGVGSVLVKIEEGGEMIFAPLLRGNNADINTTLALAIISVSLTQYYGVVFLGFKNYMKKFINISNPINFGIGLLEIVSEFSKVLSFSFRLFGNIFAGEVLLTIIAFLMPVLASFPFLLLESFVGLVQALVFSMLTAVFISNAISTHH